MCQVNSLSRQTVLDRQRGEGPSCALSIDLTWHIMRQAKAAYEEDTLGITVFSACISDGEML